MRTKAIMAASVNVLMAGLIGCVSAPTHVLPTATPAPTDVIPTATETALPPPTVTSFATATSRTDNEVIVPPSVEAGTESASASALTETTADTPSPLPEPSDTPTSTSIPSPTIEPTTTLVNLPSGVSLGDLVFKADFFQGWPSVDFPTVQMAIKDGQYVLKVGPQDAGIRSTGAVNQKNIYEQIEATPSACPAKGGYGLRFRLKDATHYYRFSILCDNTYLAAAVISGSVIELGSGKLPNGLDATTNSVHKVGVAAFNTGFTLYFDGQSVGTASDNQIDQGDVALYAFSQGPDITIVAFDNWQVWTLH